VSERGPRALAARLADDLRLALLVVIGAILLLDLPTLLTAAPGYRPFWLESAAYVVLLVVTAAAAPVVVRRAPWDRRRWPLLLAALAANTAATAAIAPAELFGSAHWSWDIFGWWAAFFLLDRPLRELLVVLTAHLGITLAQLFETGRTDLLTLDGMGISAVVMNTLPVAAWLFGSALTRLVARASRAAAEVERVRTREEIAATIHRDRQDRYCEVSKTAGPLLARLARGDVDAGDPAVRHAFFVEAARLRRIFAESDASADPLVHEVTACTDIATRRGIAVTLAVRGRSYPVAPGSRRLITEAVVQAVAAARSRARVTVTGTADRVTVTVVADAAPSPLPESPPTVSTESDVTVTWSREEAALWVEAWTTVPVGAQTLPGIAAPSTAASTSSSSTTTRPSRPASTHGAPRPIR
jgi:hypothetical protein